MNATEPVSDLAPGKATGQVIPHRPRLIQRVGAWGIVAFAKTISATFRFKFEDFGGKGRAQVSGPAIYCLWHNRLAMAEAGHQLFIKRNRPDGKLAALISASKDGAFLATILEKFEIQAVRGSSSRRGAQAMLELTSWAEKGYDLAITPDGPRGPAYVVQPGVISLSQLTGLPIVPLSFNMRRKIALDTWDKFQIPLPFSRISYMIGEPIQVPRDASDDARETLRLELETQLKKMAVD
jgi:lysophospholipid acyltransferase (LPLAT)-like uncharacterized protein